MFLVWAHTRSGWLHVTYHNMESDRCWRAGPRHEWQAEWQDLVAEPPDSG